MNEYVTTVPQQLSTGSCGYCIVSASLGAITAVSHFMPAVSAWNLPAVTLLTLPLLAIAGAVTGVAAYYLLCAGTDSARCKFVDAL